MKASPVWPEHSDDPVEAAIGQAFDARLETIGHHVDYERNPVGWAVDKLKVPRGTIAWGDHPAYADHAWDGTPDPLAVIAEALADWENVGVESGTGTGKSFWAAVMVLWFLACFKDARVFTFAPKEDQLRLFIWKEIGRLWPAFQSLFPTAQLSDLRIRMHESSDEWGAWGYAVAIKAGEQSATNAQGMHAEHMLLIYEETPGIHPAVLEAGANTCTAPHNMRLALGNPDSNDDALHQFCIQANVRHVIVSALDHPNVVAGNASIVPGAVSLKSIQEREAKYGVDSLMYDSRVRGISPAQSVDALIQRAWCETATNKAGDPRYLDGKRAWGVDVANSEAGDKAAIARWQGAALLEVESFPCPDANVLGATVTDEARAAGGRPMHVGVDSVGVGAGAVNEAKRLKFYVQSLNGGAACKGLVDEDADLSDDPETKRRKVANAEKFANLRAGMWWQMREDLRKGRIALPNDPELIADLVTPRWFTRAGKVFVESKEDIKKRLGRSPDKGDAAVYGNWVRDRRAVRLPPPEVQSLTPELLRAEAQRQLKPDWKKRKKMHRPIDPSFGSF